MLLFVGLGNIGPEYADNRHNVGFIVIDAIAERHGFPPWRSRFDGLVAEGFLGSQRVQLLKPATMMNASGVAVAKTVRHASITDIVVFLDWLQLPLGRMKILKDAGLGGHNGLRSITPLVGNDYRQVRIGIGRPESKHMVERYVLSDFRGDELKILEAMVGSIAKAVPLLAHNEDFQFEEHVRNAMRASGLSIGNQ
jgi:PTH1 family peptidyl-tRNA hydrolase